MIKNKIIVIGTNHHNTLGLIRSVGEKGLHVDVIIYSKEYYLIKSCRYIKKLKIVSLDRIVEHLLSFYSEEHNKPVILCGNDDVMSLLDKKYSILSNYFYLFNANGIEGRITKFMNKELMRETAISCGIKCPDSFIIDSNSRIPDKIDYPCMIKPISSLDATKVEIKKCYDKDDLKKKLTEGVVYLLQEYIEKEYELNMVACSLNHGNKLIIPGIIRKIREYPEKLGSSSYSVLESIKDHPAVNVEQIQKFVKTIGYEGLFSIEFLQSNGNIYFLEINMRNDGNGYVPTSAGVNLPFLWCEYITGNAINTDTSSRLPHFFMRDTTDF